MEEQNPRSISKNKDNKDIKDVQERMTHLKRSAIRHIASIPEGKIFLNILMTECGFMESNIHQNPQSLDININSMLVNEALRSLYVKLRRLIPTERLKEIEFLDLKKEALEIVSGEKEEHNV